MVGAGVSHTPWVSGVWKYGFYLNWACFSWARLLFFFFFFWKRLIGTALVKPPYIRPSFYVDVHSLCRSCLAPQTGLIPSVCWSVSRSAFTNTISGYHTHTHTIIIKKNHTHNAGIYVAHVEPNLMNCGSAVGKFNVTVDRTRANWKQTLCQYSFSTTSRAEIGQPTAVLVYICGDKAHPNTPTSTCSFFRPPAITVSATRGC